MADQQTSVQRLEQQRAYDEELCTQLDVFYEELGDRPLYTMELIKFVIDQIATLSPENPTCSFMNMKGEVHHGFDHSMLDLRRIFRPGKDDRIEIKFWTYLELASNNLNAWPFLRLKIVIKDEKHREHMLRLAKERIPVHMLSWAHSPHLLREDDLKQAESMWEQSKERANLLSCFKGALQAKQVVNFTNIVCFGLGPLWPVDLSQKRVPGWNLDHHLVAYDFAQMLAHEFKNPLSITFQDPAYSKPDLDWLQGLARNKGIQTRYKDNPRAILDVGPNTLVLAHGSPGFPIRQIIVDVTKPFQGPAGFFCVTIPQVVTTQEELYQCKIRAMDPPNRRVASMATDYNMKAVCAVDKWYSTLYLKQT